MSSSSLSSSLVTVSISRTSDDEPRERSLSLERASFVLPGETWRSSCGEGKGAATGAHGTASEAAAGLVSSALASPCFSHGGVGVFSLNGGGDGEVEGSPRARRSAACFCFASSSSSVRALTCFSACSIFLRARSFANIDCVIVGFAGLVSGGS